MYIQYVQEMLFFLSETNSYKTVLQKCLHFLK